MPAADTTVTHKALPAGWSVHEDESGRIYFSQSSSQSTAWQDPRIPRAQLTEFDNVNAPAYVKAALYLVRDGDNHSFRYLDATRVSLQVQKHRSLEEGAFISKGDFSRLVEQMVIDAVSPGERSAIVFRIVDRVFSLLDLPFKGEAEFRASLLALVLLSEIPLKEKVSHAFNIVDSQNRGELTSNQMLVLLMLISRLVENPLYRYKIVPDSATAQAYVQDMYHVTRAGTFKLVDFIRFVNTNPLPLRHLIMAEKIRLSRDVTHTDKECNVCRALPIKGIRYRVKDAKVKHCNICQTCFWAGRESADYKKGMTVIEYTTANTFGKRVANNGLLLDAPRVPRSGSAAVANIGNSLNLFKSNQDYRKTGTLQKQTGTLQKQTGTPSGTLQKQPVASASASSVAKTAPVASASAVARTAPAAPVTRAAPAAAAKAEETDSDYDNDDDDDEDDDEEDEDEEDSDEDSDEEEEDSDEEEESEDEESDDEDADEAERKEEEVRKQHILEQRARRSQTVSAAEERAKNLADLNRSQV